MELHHLHVAQRQARAQRDRDAVARTCRPRARDSGTWWARRRSRAAWPARARARSSPRRMSSMSTPASAQPSARGSSSSARCSSSRRDAARPHLLGQAIDDLDAGEIALVDGAVVGLAGERLLVDGAVGVAVEEAADLVLQLADAHRRLRHQRPGKLLVVEPAPPSSVSMKWRSIESPGASATL